VILTGVIVQGPPSERVSFTKTCFRRDDLNNPVARLPGAVREGAGERWALLKGFVLRTIGAKSELSGGGREKLLLVMLKLAHQLLHQGAFTDELEVSRTLVAQLCRLLDVPVQLDSPGKLEGPESDEGHATGGPLAWQPQSSQATVHEAQMEGLAILNTVCDLRLSVRLHMVLAVAVKVMKNKMRASSCRNLSHTFSSFGRALTTGAAALIDQVRVCALGMHSAVSCLSLPGLTAWRLRSLGGVYRRMATWSRSRRLWTSSTSRRKAGRCASRACSCR